MPSRTLSANEAVGAVIRERRIGEGLTQEKLSFRAKVHRTYISDLERGLKSPTVDVLESVAAALKTRPHILLEEADAHRGRKPHAPSRKRFRPLK